MFAVYVPRADPQEKMDLFKQMSDDQRTSQAPAMFSVNDMAVLWNRFKRKREKHPTMQSKWAHRLSCNFVTGRHE